MATTKKKKAPPKNNFSNIILQCHHCGNNTPHKLKQRHVGTLLFEQIYDEKMFDDFEFLTLSCSTCGGLNLYGEFTGILKYSPKKIESYKLLYPTGPHLHEAVPAKIAFLYNEIYHLRHQAPNAFANQVRRILEVICIQQKAIGKNLYEKLKDLSTKGKFPGQVEEIASLIRQVGNVGSHALNKELDIWDAELLNSFFLIVIEYLYIAPQKIKDLKRRLKLK